MLAVGRLDGLAGHLPDVSQFLYTYVRKEALLSSQIEGTKSSLSELLLFENAESPGVPTESVVEVSNYVAAMEHGLKRLHKGFPLSLRLKGASDPSPGLAPRNVRPGRMLLERLPRRPARAEAGEARPSPIAMLEDYSGSPKEPPGIF
jgi:hypothetical protein